MPGLSGPSDYSQEPSRHPCLQINAKEPFNAEPPRSALVSSYVTPVELFFKRNHGPIPLVDDIERLCTFPYFSLAPCYHLFGYLCWGLLLGLSIRFRKADIVSI
ncbi:hypothetical protein J1N35_000057 [Gossypium stocksii]|uniref:Uncharacterized protein n=1 Tax=Gossypium stocksii TaxID=47602 RepID=A0A9D3WG58_9ROSI|nr:hypothetical protein J1N35_000057 [Gossypium stocksii]